MLLHHFGAHVEFPSVFSPTKTADGLLRQCRPKLQADLLHTRLMVSRPFLPPPSQTTSKLSSAHPPPRVPTLRGSIADGQNRTPEEGQCTGGGGGGGGGGLKKCSHFSLPRWPLSNTGVTWRAGEPSNRRVLSHETSRPCKAAPLFPAPFNR